MTKEQAKSIRLEDLGKQLLANAEPIEESIIVRELLEHFKQVEENDLSAIPDYWLLYGKELGFHQVFEVWGASHEELADWIMGFLKAANAQEKNKDRLRLSNVTMIENASESKDSQGLDIWIGTYYFQLVPFDWGIEKVGDEGIWQQS